MMSETGSGQSGIKSAKGSFRWNLFLFLLIFLPCCWFFSAGHINQTSRYDAISAWFENTGENAHTFRIDRYLNDAKTVNTTDWSEYGGHYYSNKSPGTTLFGVALLAPVYPLERRLCPDGDGIAPAAELFNAWYVNFMLGVLPVAFSVFPLIGIFMISGMSRIKAVWCALGTILCTAIFPYATTLLAHSTVAACLIFALWLMLSGGKWRAVLAGACCGIAVLMDYSAALILVPALICIAVREKRRLLPFILGGIPFALLYAGYNAMCFGSCFALPAQYINPVYHAGNLLNIPSFRLICELLIGAQRGILLMMPVFFFALPGFFAMYRRGALNRCVAVLCAASAIALLLLNASFNGWHGGATTVARYMIPAFPAWAILAFHAPLRTRKMRLIFLSAAILSAFNMLAMAGYTVMTAENDTSPLYRTTYAHLADTAPPVTLRTPPGRLAFHADFAKWQRAGTFTLGSLIGMNYFVSRAVLWVLLAVGLGILFWRSREKWAEYLDLQSMHVKKPDAFAVLLLVICALLCVAPQLIPWGARESAAAFVEPGPGATAPFSAVGVFCGRAFFSAFSLLTKSVFVTALLKTLFSLGVTAVCLHYAAKRLKVNSAVMLLILFASPCVMLAHRALDPASILLPAGAVLLAGACYVRPYLQRYSAYLRPVCVIAGVGLLLTAIGVSRDVRASAMMPLETLSAFGFADFFCAELRQTDPDAYFTLKIAGCLSLVLSAVPVLTGIVVRRGHFHVLLVALALAGVGPVLFGIHPFSVLVCAPVLAYFAAAGIAYFAEQIRKHELPPVVLQSAKGMFAFYIVFCALVWVMFLGVLEKGNGFAAGPFGTTLAHQSELVSQARNSMIHHGIPQNEVRIVSAKKDAPLLNAYAVLYRMDAVDRPYHLRKEDIAADTRRPAVLLRRANEVTHDGTLKVLLSYPGR